MVNQRKEGRLKLEKVKGGRPLCVLGKDITFDMVMALSQRVLIGKFEYINMLKIFFLSWVRSKWKTFIENFPRVLRLVNGWVVF